MASYPVAAYQREQRQPGAAEARISSCPLASNRDALAVGHPVEERLHLRYALALVDE